MRALACLAALLLAACGSSVTNPDGGGGGGTSVGGESAAGGAGGSIGSMGGFDAGPVGSPCPPEPCNTGGLACIYDDGLCGTGAAGICHAADACASTYQGAVCGCDDQIYADACAAQAAGVDAALNTACPTPAGFFPCLARQYCHAATEMCRENVGFALSPGCEPLPAACDPAQGGLLDCSCVAALCDVDMCTVTPEGGLSIICHTDA
jgi:hypothetical protein